jgi:hypothetical protein
MLVSRIKLIANRCHHPKTALAAQVCGEEWEDRVALDAGGAAHLTERAQFERIMAAGYLAFDQAPLLQVHRAWAAPSSRPAYARAAMQQCSAGGPQGWR